MPRKPAGSPGKKRVAVIGAGPSGLVTVKELLQEGHDVVCFDRADGLGGVFRYRPFGEHVSVWRTCRLTSSAFVTGFSDYLPPADGADAAFPHRQLGHEEYLAYLTSYARRFGVLSRIRFGCEVVRTTRARDGGWRVTVRVHTRSQQIYEVDAVAVCSGLHRVPHVPQLRGLESFAGKVLHSAHYRGPESLHGHSALFIGAGESGGDILAEAAQSLDRCYLSLRRDVFVLPRLLNGRPNDYTGTRLLYSLPDFVSRRSDRQALQLKRRLALALFPLAGLRRAVDHDFNLLAKGRLRRTPVYVDARRQQVERLIMRMRASSQGNQFETFATKTEGFVEAIVDGQCAQRGAVREITSTGAVFADGTRVDVDTIVLCTGFEPASAPFISEQVDLRCLYKHCFNPEQGKDLAFIGLVRPTIGAIPPLAEMQARWFAQLCSGRLTLPPSGQMRSEAEREYQHRQERYHQQVFDRLPQLVDFSSYLDEVAEIIGCKPRMADLVRRPRLLYKLYTSAFSGIQYRLRGPHAQPEFAAQALRFAHSHVRPVRFLDLAAAELARLVGARRLQPHLTLIGTLRHDRDRRSR